MCECDKVRCVLSTAYSVCGSALHFVSPADGVDEKVDIFASCLKNLRKLELTKCHSISSVQIATILNGLKENSSLEEMVVTVDYKVSHVR